MLEEVFTGCWGFRSSFRSTHGDVSTSMILTPGSVIDFLLANQNAREHCYIDWAKAKRMLKNIRIKTRHNREFKIIGLSDKPCKQLFFSLKVKNSDGSYDGGQTTEITVYKYFSKHRNIELTYSAYMHCLDVGKPKQPNYLPLEFGRLWETTVMMMIPSLLLLAFQLRNNSPKLMVRSLRHPKLKVGNSEDCFPHNGQWNFNYKVSPIAALKFQLYGLFWWSSGITNSCLWISFFYNLDNVLHSKRYSLF
ncbi:unnamed protein product [Ilex paraguariensis]|uniref:PAZ domain-containing protein n=1 Tax=Ilex paraguariensis TaxID=185542 RepID=A0ABC8TBX1_9AQUA